MRLYITSVFVLQSLQAGSLTTLDKALSCMDEAKRKKLEEMVQEAAQGRKPAAARPPPVAAAASRGSSRAPSQPASVSGSCRLANLWHLRVACCAILLDWHTS